MTDWLLIQLSDWLIDWLVDWLTDKLTDCVHPFFKILSAFFHLTFLQCFFSFHFQFSFSPLPFPPPSPCFITIYFLFLYCPFTSLPLTLSSPLSSYVLSLDDSSLLSSYLIFSSFPFPSLPFPSPPFLSLKSCSFILLRIDISHSLSNPFLLLLLLLLLFLKDVTSVQPKGYPESLVTSITVSLSGLFIDLTHAKILSKICLFFTEWYIIYLVVVFCVWSVLLLLLL